MRYTVIEWTPRLWRVDSWPSQIVEQNRCVDQVGDHQIVISLHWSSRGLWLWFECDKCNCSDFKCDQDTTIALTRVDVPFVRRSGRPRVLPGSLNSTISMVTDGLSWTSRASHEWTSMRTSWFTKQMLARAGLRLHLRMWRLSYIHAPPLRFGRPSIIPHPLVPTHPFGTDCSETISNDCFEARRLNIPRGPGWHCHPQHLCMNEYINTWFKQMNALTNKSRRHTNIHTFSSRNIKACVW